MNSESLSAAVESFLQREGHEFNLKTLDAAPKQFASDAGAESGLYLQVSIYNAICVEFWIPTSGRNVFCSYVPRSQNTPVCVELPAINEEDCCRILGDKIAAIFAEHSAIDTSGMNDDDRIVCPFCGCCLYPGSKTATETEWYVGEASCKHTLFIAVDAYSFAGFEHRSRYFNKHLGVPESDDVDVEIPSGRDPEEFLSIEEIVQKLVAEIPDLVTREYAVEGGIACGPIPGGTVTFGLVRFDTDS